VTKLGRTAAGVVSILGVAAGLTACGSDADVLTVYSAQHESLVRTMLEDFTEETGIELEFRDANDSELANQIVEEGEASPADVFLTENSPAIDVVDEAGLLAPLDDATLDQVDEAYRPSSGTWVGFAARSTVLIYNPAEIAEDELPASMLDLADPAWEGRVGIAAGGADFQAIVSAMLELEGEEKTEAWLQAMKVNYKNYSGNNTVLQGVNSGEIDGGIIYHYYWYRDQAKTKENSNNAKLLFFTGKDPGGFLSVSGGGVLETAKHADEAQQFLKFITGPTGQQALADSAEFEYTVGSKVPANPALQPLSELDPPKVDPSKLNGPKVIELMSNAGLI
jgi:iron(III) transport system substrate-binding protein